MLPLWGRHESDRDGVGRAQDRGGSGVIGMTVITVNMADFADIRRTAANLNRNCSLGLEPGDYLVQVEEMASYAYINVEDGSTAVQNLGV